MLPLEFNFVRNKKLRVQLFNNPSKFIIHQNENTHVQEKMNKNSNKKTHHKLHSIEFFFFFWRKTLNKVNGWFCVCLDRIVATKIKTLGGMYHKFYYYSFIY